MSARLFVAVELGADDREALAEWGREVIGEDPGLRPVAVDNLHLTLAFLGHRSLAELEDVAGLVDGFDVGPAPDLRTAGALWLAPRRPHVLTVAIGDDSGRLGRLHGRLWDGLEAIGLVREERPFRPHVTVARVRRGWSISPQPPVPAPARPLTARSVVLYRAYLGGGRGGPEYEAQARAEFVAEP